MTKTMTKTMSVTVGAILAAAVLLPAVASADTRDIAYCSALADKAERYLATGSAKSRPPMGVETRAAIEHCRAGDPSGISALEKALQNAKISLPSRT